MSILICIGLLFIGALGDVKNRTVSIFIPIIGMLAGFILFCIDENRQGRVAGFIFGAIILMISVAIKDFGSGDGFMVLVLGFLRGIGVCVETLLIAFLALYANPFWNYAINQLMLRSDYGY